MPFPSVRIDADRSSTCSSAAHRRERRSPLPRRRADRPRGADGVGTLRRSSTARPRASAPAARARRSTCSTPTATPSSCATTEVRRPTMALNLGDVVDDFELPDETGTPRTSERRCSRTGPVVLFFYPAAMTHRVHEGELPLPRPRVRVRRSRRATRRHQLRHGRQAARSSPRSTASTTRCCPTPTARSPG